MTAPAFAPTRAIGALIADTRLRVDESFIGPAVAAFTDTIGVALAGAADSAAQIAMRVAQSQFASDGSPATTVFGGPASLSACGAAFVNAVAAHALDYDDVSTTVQGHPSALLVPVLLALAETDAASGREMIEAYLVGLHVASSVGAGFDMGAGYARGWHTTSVLGSLGATAAAARLRRLDQTQARMAIGIAASLAAGSRASFGTMTKPLHVGATAVNAILAVDLAQSGFSANLDIVEAPLGFLALHAESVTDLAAISQALARPVGAAVTEIDIKRYPCCYYSHRMIDAALALRARLLTTASDLRHEIKHIRITTSPGGTAGLIYHQPATPTEAKFSAEYTVTAALLDGTITSATFQQPAITRDDATALLDVIDVEESPDPPYGPPAWRDAYAVVEIVTHSGQHLTERVDVPKGAHPNPLSPAQLHDKFTDCATRHPTLTIDAPAALTHLTALPADTNTSSLLARILQGKPTQSPTQAALGWSRSILSPHGTDLACAS